MTRSKHYGFLGGVGGKVTLSLEEVGRVIKVVGKELERRCELAYGGISTVRTDSQA